MPKGEIESHPYLHYGHSAKATKLILGSFPVYECTDNDNPTKQITRVKEGTVRFFYGSNRNSLWHKYKQHIDKTITQPWDPSQIMHSLASRRIAITDTIKSCERYKIKIDIKTGERKLNPYSSEDSALRGKNWNRELLQSIVKEGITKVLCTSKGVLRDFEKHFVTYRKAPLGKVDLALSESFQKQFIESLGGNNKQIKKPVARVFLIGNIKVCALAIPSPGSAQRRLVDFGFNGQNSMFYAESYFSKAFEWLDQEDIIFN